ncbi:MAG: hypothetical protein A2Z35_03740 [Actinobacteria bacterium RBG_19FT_COMBO_36_27]|nr:MAG: hypothetical protein A2Z35_03740 [Actinobacteria bacterium RBG_19FT_COMBO_36_27]
MDSPSSIDWAVTTSDASAGKLWFTADNEVTSDTSDTIMTVNSWYYVTLVSEGSSARLYINGALENEIDNSFGLVPGVGEMKIGYSTHLAKGFSGVIDEFKLYDYAISTEQILSDMNAGHPVPGSPVGSAYLHYMLDEGHDSTSTNNGNGGTSLNGTITNGTWTNNGKFNKALTFASNTDISATILDPGYTHSLSLWVYPTTSAANKTLITTGKLTTNGSSQPAYGNCIGTTLSLNTWTHLVAVSDGSGSCTIYQNGVQTASSTEGISFGTDVSIGDSSFTGIVDDIKIYTAALDTDQVKVDYNKGAAISYGAPSTDSSGKPSFSSADEYCPPGQGSTCTGPIGEWKMNEKIDSTVNDTSGSGFAASFSGTPIWKGAAECKIGACLSFDNVTNDYLDLGDQAGLSFTSSSAKITIEAWIKPDSSVTQDRAIFSKYDSQNNEIEYTFFLDASNDELNFWMSENGSSANVWKTSTADGVITDNIWQHVAVVVDVGVDTVNYYINGKSYPRTNDENSSITDMSNLTEPARIGVMRCGDGSMCNYWKGRMDNILLYNYARTPAQIAWDYNEGSPLLEYRFDECQGDTVYNQALDADGQAAGNNATITIGASGDNTSVGTCSSLVGTEAWNNGASGKLNASIDLDGTNDYLATSNVALIRVSSTTYTNASWGTWVYPTSSPTSKTLIHKNNEFRFNTNGSNIPLCGIYSSSWQPSAISSIPLPTSEWSHVMCTYDGTNIKIYINGNLTGSQGEGDPITSTSSTALNIGRDSAGSGYFDGRFDDTRIYNYALTSVQISNIFNLGGIRLQGP